MFGIIGKVLKPATKIVGKLAGNKENREMFAAKAAERADKRSMAELGYRQSKLAPWLYTAMVLPLAIMWLSFGFHPIITEVPIESVKRIAVGYYKLLEAFGLDNLTYVIFSFLGISGGSETFKGIKMSKLTDEINASRKVEEDRLICDEKDRVLSYDLDFIAELEGGNHPSAYTIPGEIGKKSGVTIGIGVDLGYQSLEKYESVGLGKRLQTKIAPYLGVKGEDANKLLDSMPLALTSADTALLNEATMKIYAKETRKHFKGKMCTYPEEVQTVIMSRAWHGGTNLPKNAPKFYQYCRKEDWSAVVRELRNFYPKKNGKMPHNNRLVKEANLIESII